MNLVRVHSDQAPLEIPAAVAPSAETNLSEMSSTKDAVDTPAI